MHKSNVFFLFVLFLIDKIISKYTSHMESIISYWSESRENVSLKINQKIIQGKLWIQTC